MKKLALGALLLTAIMFFGSSSYAGGGYVVSGYPVVYASYPVVYSSYVVPACYGCYSLFGPRYVRYYGPRYVYGYGYYPWY